MPMINCPECGKQISDKADKCPNCGYPLHISTTPQTQQMPQQESKKKGNLGLDILIAILLFIMPLAPIGIIIMWVKKVPQSKGTRIAATVIFGFLFLFWLSGGTKSDNKEIKTDEPQVKVEASKTDVQNNNSKEKIAQEEKAIAETQKTIEVNKEEFMASCEEIPYKTLARTPEDYKGKHIKLTVKISQIMQGGFLDNGEYYRAYTNDEYDFWSGDEYLIADKRKDKDIKILQDDILTVYGEFYGTRTMERALTGAKEDVLTVNAVYMELLEDDAIISEDNEVEDDGISKEYKSALKKAQSYNDTMYMSKQALFDQLASEYGEKFPEDAAQYAIDNVEADWNANALKKAQNYQEQMSMSKSAIYDQLTSEYGEQFTPDEAQYAIDNLD